MEENPFSEGNRYTACPEIVCLNIKPTRLITTFTKACYWILSIINSIQILIPYFFDTHVIQFKTESCLGKQVTTIIHHSNIYNWWYELYTYITKSTAPLSPPSSLSLFSVFAIWAQETQNNL